MRVKPLRLLLKTEMRAAQMDRSHFLNQQTESLGASGPLGAFPPLAWTSTAGAILRTSRATPWPTTTGTTFSTRPTGTGDVFHEVVRSEERRVGKECVP